MDTLQLNNVGCVFAIQLCHAARRKRRCMGDCLGYHPSGYHYSFRVRERKKETGSCMFVGSAHTLVRIYYTRRLLKWFYARKQSNEEANLKSLRAQQKLKVEELKKKTSYYTTKSILERYDPAAAEKAKKEAAQQQQQQHARTTARAAPDQQARMRLPQTNGAGTMEFFFAKKEAKERDIDV